LKLVDLAAELQRRQRRVALVLQQPVDLREVRCDIRRVHAVVHLRREDVRPVVAEAPFAGELDDRQWLDGVDAEVAQVRDLVQRVEELRHAAVPAVLAGRVAREEAPDVQLVDDEVGPRGRLEVLVVPRVGVWVAHDGVDVRKAVQLELARPRVALWSRSAGADDEEAVLRAVDDASDKAGPVAAGGVLDELVLGPRHVAVDTVEHDVHVPGGGRPNAERRAARHQIRAHRGRC
jgi:hypothetical protein